MLRCCMCRERGEEGGRGGRGRGGMCEARHRGRRKKGGGGTQVEVLFVHVVYIQMCAVCSPASAVHAQGRRMLAHGCEARSLAAEAVQWRVGAVGGRGAGRAPGARMWCCGRCGTGRRARFLSGIAAGADCREARRQWGGLGEDYLVPPVCIKSESDDDDIPTAVGSWLHQPYTPTLGCTATSVIARAWHQGLVGGPLLNSGSQQLSQSNAHISVDSICYRASCYSLRYRKLDFLVTVDVESKARLFCDVINHSCKNSGTLVAML